MKSLTFALMLSALALTPDRAHPGESPDLEWVFFSQGLNAPVGMATVGDSRSFIAEKNGSIAIVQASGQVNTNRFLNITDMVNAEQENGLIGIAFHPQYATNGYFYVHYINADPLETRISRFSVSADPDIADRMSENILLTIPQIGAIHRGGRIFFGADGYLYVPLGDGGIRATAQSAGFLRGGIARIDVDLEETGLPDCFGNGSGEYRIPTASNAYADGPGKQCDELWAIGVRNPWQTAFDSDTGLVAIADVGEGDQEEVTLVSTSRTDAINLGWACFEGSADAFPSECENFVSYTFPDFEYSHTLGNCAVIGGAVYRGLSFPELDGRYFFGDLCTGNIWSMSVDAFVPGSTVINHGPLTGGGQLLAFGTDSAGEIYGLKTTGTLERLEIPEPLPDVIVVSTFEVMAGARH